MTGDIYKGGDASPPTGIVGFDLDTLLSGADLPANLLAQFDRLDAAPVVKPDTACTTNVYAYPEINKRHVQVRPAEQ